MDTTIRNLDEDAYRRLRAHAALHGRTVGDALNEAIVAYLARAEAARKRGSFARLPVADFGKGTERLSEEINETLYGG